MKDSNETPTISRRATGFHQLRVTAVDKLTDDAVAISLDVPRDLTDTFAHRAGQHLTVRHFLGGPDGKEIRRSYSICSPPTQPPTPDAGLRIVVKRLGDGGFGEYALTSLGAGDTLVVGPPTGGFRLAEHPGAHHVLVAGGSGITPLLSMAAAALREDPACRVSLVYANQTSMSVLLADELADLKDAYVDRFFVLNVLSQETQGATLLSGRIDTERLPRLLELLGAEPDDGTYFYLCGPWGLVEGVRGTLAEWGADSSRIRLELFTTDGEPGRQAPEPVDRSAPAAHARITARLSGRTTVFAMEPEDNVVLDAVLRARPETPYSCRDGLCGTCRAKVVCGSVQMDRQYALGQEELDRGYTLACRARAVSTEVELDFDA
ncbi:2Fe-2S iron-sulfur cluster-binding protein [Streptomyces sp. NK08204]|uniref:2Fe-2S iron-sulfur cluster-binding protein n=1 Tax=Streptomyces sp. NK08204 TaxID=2873260 RepID=UPI001CEC8700|nr:2Fe-2S iron-sulfur cluster-binding protein [Streptomyces sp. NK08204]